MFISFSFLRFQRITLLLLACFTFTRCTLFERPILEPQDKPETLQINHFQQFAKEPLTPDETEELLSEVGGNWLYGQGVGETALAVGTIVAFPPAVIWYLGNAAITVSGYKPLGVSTVLPEEESETWNAAYDTVLSGPGRAIAAVAGEEYRTKEMIRENLRKYIEPEQAGAPTPEE